MLLKDLTRALLRRWYLLVLGLALAAFSGYSVWQEVGPRYQAVGSTVLIPPKSSIEKISPNGTDGNPLIFLGELGQARDVLMSVMSSDAVQEDFAAKCPGSTDGGAADPLANGRILVLSVSAPTAGDAVAGVHYLSDEMENRFSAVQDKLSVSAGAEIRTMVLTEANTPTVDNKSQMRLSLVVSAVVLVLSIFLVALVDGLGAARRRRRKRQQKLSAADPAETVETAAEPGATTPDVVAEPAPEAPAEPAEPAVAEGESPVADAAPEPGAGTQDEPGAATGKEPEATATPAPAPVRRRPRREPAHPKAAPGEPPGEASVRDEPLPGLGDGEEPRVLSRTS